MSRPLARLALNLLYVLDQENDGIDPDQALHLQGMIAEAIGDLDTAARREFVSVARDLAKAAEDADDADRAAAFTRVADVEEESL